ncbi:MAG: hypothetical protein EZS28_020905 [Streblomastix strix]|uniref:Uncharacterized protein n=1 Tax=Streblomastix strix TaxID=222440 RepID=A0A5J4VLT8_9EUKA|nr:MAG: hypothetical protein EZS28_020905 [Streblomastix strix]
MAYGVIHIIYPPATFGRNTVASIYTSIARQKFQSAQFEAIAHSEPIVQSLTFNAIFVIRVATLAKVPTFKSI